MHDRRYTRARLLRTALGGGAVAAGGAAIGHWNGATSTAAPSADAVSEVLNLFLTLEYVQERFYAEAVEAGDLTEELLSFAQAAGKQERDHVAFLTERLGSRARARPRTDFGDLVSTPERFQDTAAELEEQTIAVYVGQAANLPRDAVAGIATLVSVEARQAAWIRDVAGLPPAPRAADPARKPGDVLSDLRERGFLA